jgi:pimeloyl-ACP methyl ester carboxylesterase
LKLFYRKSGNGPPLLILHGLFGSSDNWVSMMSMLKDHFTVIVPDERNHGRSPHSDRFDYEAMRDDALELLEAEGLKSAYVAGHSMGGKVAMEMAIQAPEAVKKLIVLDISPKSYPIRHEFILRGLKSMNLASIKSRQEADDQLASYIGEQRIRQFLLKNLTRQSDGRFKWKINLSAIEENIQNIGKAQFAEKPVKVPSLFIGGEKSDYITSEDENLIRRIFPVSRIVMVPGAGHWLHAERPDTVYRLITEFLLKTKLTVS